MGGHCAENIALKQIQTTPKTRTHVENESGFAGQRAATEAQADVTRCGAQATRVCFGLATTDGAVAVRAGGVKGHDSVGGGRFKRAEEVFSGEF